MNETPSAGQVVATQTRSGGFAGIDEKLTVYADGTLQLERQGTTQTTTVDPAMVRKLQQTVKSPEWSKLPAKIGQPVPDAFTYAIEAGGKTVTTYDGVDYPEPLATAMQEFAVLYGAAAAP
jgi:hypothetical protein